MNFGDVYKFEVASSAILPFRLGTELFLKLSGKSNALVKITGQNFDV